MAVKTPGVWGIDLGQCALKALRLENNEGTLTATAFDYVEHPKILSQPDADPDQLTREALEQFLSRNTIRGDMVVISVPGQSGLARFVKLPPVEEKKIADIVRFEAKQQIPFNLDEVVWDYQKIGASNVVDGFALETEIGLFAMKRDMVNRYLQHFQDVNVEVHLVQMAPLALPAMSVEDIGTIAKNTRKPLSVNMGFGIRQRSTTPLLSAKQLQDLGVSVVIYPRMLTACALIGHAFLVSSAIVTVAGLDLSLANALSAVAGMTALFAWLGSLTRSLPGVVVVALPVAALASWLPFLFANPHRFSFTEEPWAALHIAVALIAYALLIVATMQALMLMGLQKRLHRGLPEPNAGELPPLLTMEQFLFRIVGAGFALLTLTLATGIFFSEQLFGKALTYSNKIIFSVLSWVVFGALLYGRKRYGWRGRTALNWIMAGSVLLLLAYVGSKLLPESVFGA